MKIVIDTKEDVHILRHIINLLHAISSNAPSKRYDYSSDSGSSQGMFSESSSSSIPSSVPETPTGVFNMFDTPSSSSSDIPGMFQEPKKEEEKVKDFIDSLRVY